MGKSSKIFTYVGVITAVVVLSAFGVFIRNTKDVFFNYYSQQLNNYSNVFRKAIEIADDYTQIYEQLLAEDLYYRLSALNQELENVPLNYINRRRLEALKEKYDLFGLAIFARDATGIYIYDSTIEAEIGQRTEDWGYWQLAFESLF